MKETYTTKKIINKPQKFMFVYQFEPQQIQLVITTQVNPPKSITSNLNTQNFLLETKELLINNSVQQSPQESNKNKKNGFLPIGTVKNQEQSDEQESEFLKDESDLQKMKKQYLDDITAIDLGSSKLISCIVLSVSVDEIFLRKIRQKIQQQQQDTFKIELFDLLKSKLSKIKKNKEEKLKFFIRKLLRMARNRGFCHKDNAQDNKFSADINEKKFMKMLGMSYKSSSISQRNLQKSLLNPEFRQKFREVVQDTQLTFYETNMRKVYDLTRIMKQCLKESALVKLKTRTKLPWTENVYRSILQFGKQIIRDTEQNLKVK